MRRNTLEHTPIHQEEYDRTENLNEWNQRAVEPFVQHVLNHNPHLAQEIASMGDPKADLSQVSWLDRPSDENRWQGHVEYTRDPTASEHHIFQSYQESRQLLDPVQQQYAAHTIADAMSYRPADNLNQHLPQGTDYAKLHHDGRVPFGASYNSVMETARNYYLAALQAARQSIADGLYHQVQYDMTEGTSDLRKLEHDVRNTALTGHMPDSPILHHSHRDYTAAVEERADIINNAFNSYLQYRFPDRTPTPEEEDYLTVFQQYADQFPQADAETMADHAAAQYSSLLHQQFRDAPNYNHQPFHYRNQQEIKDQLLARLTPRTPD